MKILITLTFAILPLLSIGKTTRLVCSKITQYKNEIKQGIDTNKSTIIINTEDMTITIVMSRLNTQFLIKEISYDDKIGYVGYNCIGAENKKVTFGTITDDRIAYLKYEADEHMEFTIQKISIE